MKKEKKEKEENIWDIFQGKARERDRLNTKANGL